MIKLVEQLNNTEAFKLKYIPTLSADSSGFNPLGYWCGGYWPRESSYLGFAFNKCGYKEEALELVLKALCSQKGCIIAENMNPYTGVNNTGQTKLAYCALLNVALLEIVEEKTFW